MDWLEPPDLFPPGAGAPTRALIDVRAPIEVARGALPGAHNRPILEDDERHLVGLRYEEAGQEAAYALGVALTEARMPARVEAWRALCEAGPTALFCWRGGLRSRLAQELIARDDVPRVRGGYKALRRHLRSEAAAALARKRALVVGGLTGSGKTELLAAPLPEGVQALDLEAAARHRGSAFGGLGAQPSQASFENELATALTLDGSPLLLVEDESRNIGRRTLPEPLWAAMADAPLLLLEAPLAERVRRIHRDYVLEPLEREGLEPTLGALEAAVLRLRSRLGTATVERMTERLRSEGRAAPRDPAAFAPVIGELLERHYDPLYRKALARSGRTVAARGDKETLLAWIGRHASD